LAKKRWLDLQAKAAARSNRRGLANAACGKYVALRLFGAFDDAFAQAMEAEWTHLPAAK
jgi:hypothetical protein